MVDLLAYLDPKIIFLSILLPSLLFILILLPIFVTSVSWFASFLSLPLFLCSLSSFPWYFPYFFLSPTFPFLFLCSLFFLTFKVVIYDCCKRVCPTDIVRRTLSDVRRTLSVRRSVLQSDKPRLRLFFLLVSLNPYPHGLWNVLFLFKRGGEWGGDLVFLWEL